MKSPPGDATVTVEPARTGRPRVTSRAELERIGFELFALQGFDDTTVDDIAAAAGIGRRTFFRYFSSKNDLVWGDFEEHLLRLRELLAATSTDAPLVDASSSRSLAGVPRSHPKPRLLEEEWTKRLAADARGRGDVVHRGVVEALKGEQLEPNPLQLGP